MRTTAGQEVPPGDEEARFHAFLSPEDRDYLAARRRWRGRQFLREQRGEQGREPEPWPTRWVRHRVGTLPISALFPGQPLESPSPEADDGQGIDARSHHHAAAWFHVSGETRPIADAGQQVTDEQVEHVVRTALDMFASDAARRGDVVLERGLPAPYRLVAHRRVERLKTDASGGQVTVYLTEGFAVVRGPAGDHWQLRFTIDSRVGHFEDSELLARFLRSLQFE